MSLPEMERVPYIVPMRSLGRGLLRAAMAVVFGFMSLMHGPVMTFAKADSAPAHHVSHHGARHHHAAPAEDSQPTKPDLPPVCYAFGCFIALNAVALREPPAILNPIGVLSPAPTDALRAEDVEPAIPPPRFHV